MNDEQYISSFLDDAITIINQIDRTQILNMIHILEEIRSNRGRLFILGVGGGAGHASHAVNDFRKIAGIEAYAPTDNVSELTARVNDDGWETVFENWLKGSHLNNKDAIFVFSVGGGNEEKKVSVNLVNALRYAKGIGTKIIGVVGRDGGYTGKVADACVIIPTVNDKSVTPQTEAFQAVVWHLIVSSPSMQMFDMKWEGII
ncbi:SIS domain-containing protein [Methanospirillum stamsii]|uniref:Sugar isomerase n=1 Tax=Methanospirillum stamsii TaxID=1277351 RepID=A0A2V2NIE9_9EURY|nr:SIS domain-containing protein [Methanospirillum stamsii]PWR76187.1 sugar isomerase [Methanospirillum stamsii]